MNSPGLFGALAIRRQRRRLEEIRRSEKLRQLTAEERKFIIQIEKNIYSMHEKRHFKGSSFELLYLGIIFIGVAIGIFVLGLMIHESLVGVSAFLFFIGLIIICLYYCVRNEEDEELKYIKKQYEKARKVTDRLGYDIELYTLGRPGKNYDTLTENQTLVTSNSPKKDVEATRKFENKVAPEVKKINEYELEEFNSKINELTESETSESTVK